MTPQGPDWDAFDSSPTTTDRREAARNAVIEAARFIVDVIDGGYVGPIPSGCLSLCERVRALDAVGTPDERKP
jgi:hypothetical protein